MLLLRNEKKIIFADCDGKTIQQIDLNGNRLFTFSQNLFNCPYGLGIDGKNQLIIGDSGNNGDKQHLIVLNSTFNFIKNFERDTKQAISMDLAIDRLNNNLLYLTSTLHDRVSIWSVASDEYLNDFKIDRPNDIELVGEFLYITSKTYYDSFYTTSNTLFKITEGSNCIFIVNKTSHEITRTIRFVDWLAPEGLYIDQNLNMITTAYHLDNDFTISQSRYLYLINSSGDTYKKIYLETIKEFYDMIVVDNKVIFNVGENNMVFVELE